MNNIQTGPKISIFDKRAQANLNRFVKKTDAPKNQARVNVPQFRINQHKGA